MKNQRLISICVTMHLLSRFTQYSKYPENKIHVAPSGNMVRSKSEVLIDMQLYTNHIPFRYECELQLGDVTIYPDFTVRNPRTGKLYYSNN